MSDEPDATSASSADGRCEGRGKEDSRRAFASKNERRRQAKAQAKRSSAKHGRALRRALGGAFGRAPDTVYKTAAQGTTATADVVQRAIDDAASNSDGAGADGASTPPDEEGWLRS